MAHFGQIVRRRRLALDLSQQQLAERATLHRNTLNRIERVVASPREVHPSTLTLLAGALGVEPQALIDEAAAPPPAVTRGDPDGDPAGRQIPVINQAPAGEPVDYEEFGVDSGQGYTYLPRSPWQVGDDLLFAFVVVGDSMAPEFQPGDYVVCRHVEPDQIRDGEPCFVRLGAAHETACTFKRAFALGDRVELRPDNPRHRPRIVDKADILRMAPVVEKRTRYGSR